MLARGNGTSSALTGVCVEAQKESPGQSAGINPIQTFHWRVPFAQCPLPLHLYQAGSPSYDAGGVELVSRWRSETWGAAATDKERHMKRFLIVGAVAFVATGQRWPPIFLRRWHRRHAPRGLRSRAGAVLQLGRHLRRYQRRLRLRQHRQLDCWPRGNTLVPTGTYTLSGNNFSGGLAGGTVGFNYQWAAIVAGLEGDWDWSGQSRSSSVGCGAGCTLNDSSKLPWIATARGSLATRLIGSWCSGPAASPSPTPATAGV